MTRKKTHEEFIKQMSAINPSITILGHYDGNSNKIKCRCNVCGNEWLGTPSHLLNGHGCRKCANRAFADKRRWTHEHFIKELSKVNDKVIIKSQYRGAKHPIECECSICGHTWTTKPAILLSGRGCRKCGYKQAVETRAANNDPNDIRRRLTQAEFEDRLHSINPNVKILGEYHALKNRIRTECLLCGHIWSPTGTNLLAGYGCPNCNNGSTSYPEQYIYRAFVAALGEENVISRDTSVIGKELDIYLPSISFAVEYGSWHWHKDKMDEDKSKKLLCKERGIRLVTVLDNCPRDFSDADFWCYYKKLERNDADLQALVARLFDECGLVKMSDSIDYSSVDQAARKISRRKTTEEFKLQLSQVNPNLIVLGEYSNSKNGIRVQCSVCGYIWTPSPNNLLRGMGCPACNNANKRTRRAKPVLCVETGSIYDSIGLACEATNSRRGSISDCCYGKRETAGGYHWKFVDTEIEKDNHK